MSILVGNDCNYVLSHVDSLAEKVPDHLVAFVTVMRALNNVKDACFSTDFLDPNYKEIIREFEKSVEDLKTIHGVNIINKWHILTKHLPQWIDKYQRPLGRYGEHELEALHHRYSQYRTRRFICSNKSKLTYSDKFFRACVTLNADAT